MPENDLVIKVATDLSEVEASATKMKAAFQGAASGINATAQQMSRTMAQSLRDQNVTAEHAAQMYRQLGISAGQAGKEIQAGFGGGALQVKQAAAQSDAFNRAIRENVSTLRSLRMAAYLTLGLLSVGFYIVEWQRLTEWIGNAASALGGYDSMLKTIEADARAASAAALLTSQGLHEQIMSALQSVHSLDEANRTIARLNLQDAQKGLENQAKLVRDLEAEVAARERIKKLARESVGADVERTAQQLAEVKGLQEAIQSGTNAQKSDEQVTKLLTEAKKNLGAAQARLRQLTEQARLQTIRDADAHRKAAEAARLQGAAWYDLTTQARLNAETLNKLAEASAAYQKGVMAKTVEGWHGVEEAIQAQFQTEQKGFREHWAMLERGQQYLDEVAAKEKQAAEHVRQAFERTASSIEGFINRVFLTARSFADVFHQFLMQIVGSLVTGVSRMIAAAALGMRQATSATGGGFLGTILGGTLGINLGGAGGGALALAAGGGNLGVGNLGAGLTTLPIDTSNLGLIAGLPTQLSTGGIPAAAGGASGGALGQLAFGKITPDTVLQLLTLGTAVGGLGLLASAWKSGGIVKGAGGGALLGWSIAGPLGAAVGLWIGGILGWIRRGQAKEQATAIEQQFEFASQDLLKQFKQYQVDYESALAGMQALILQGQQSELTAGLGKWGKKGAQNLAYSIGEDIRNLQELQRQRQMAAQVLQGMSIPEFQAGGLVGFRMADNQVLAILHRGEYVMRREAVDVLGTSFLGALNRAPRFDAGGSVGTHLNQAIRPIHIGSIIVQPQRGMTDLEAARMVVRGVRRAARDGAL